MNLFFYTDQNKRYHTLDYFYRKKFHSKISKISLNAGFSCPNIDGTVGTGGCIYCSSSGSGEFAGNKRDDLITQFESVKKVMDKKWSNCQYIGYFQAHTNTYAPLFLLKEKYETILKLENVIGLAIATRPDSISIECMDYLKELSQNYEITVELGLQTIHEKTSIYINRCHSLKCFSDCVANLRKRNISVVVHIMNGLPYETKEMMLETIKYLNQLDIQGIKIHMLHVLKNTKLGNDFIKQPFPILTKKEYIDIVCDQLELLRPEIVIHRITGDPKIEDLIEPFWLTKKLTILNDIDKELSKRNTYQGFQLESTHKIKQIMQSIKKNDLVINLVDDMDSFLKTLTNKPILKDFNPIYQGKISFIYEQTNYILSKDIEEKMNMLNHKGTYLLVTSKNTDFLNHIPYSYTVIRQGEISIISFHL